MSRASSRAALRASLAVCALLTTQSVFAQVPATPDRVTVVITATRTPEHINRVGSAIDVVTNNEITVTNPTSLVDALRVVPGLDITETGGPAGTTVVRLRGANAEHTLVLIDGVRVNDPSSVGGEFDFTNLVPSSVERIEVLRGPQSALYGSDAIGGVINIITKKGGGPIQVEAQGQFGSYGTVTGSGTITGGRDGWSWAASAGAQRSDGFSRYGYRVNRIPAPAAGWERDGFDRVGGYVRLGYDTGRNLSFEGAILGLNTRSEYDSSFGTFRDTPSESRQSLLFGYGRTHFGLFDNRFRSTVTVFANETYRSYNEFSYGATPRIAFGSRNTFTGTRRGAEYQGTLDLPTGFGTLVVGGRTETETLDGDSQTLAPTIGAITARPDRSQVTNSLFTLYQLPIGERLTLTAGGRMDRVVNGDQFNTWRTTAAYQIPETGTTLRASAGTGAKAAALDQRFGPGYGNPDLQSETSTGWDVGIDQRFLDGALTASITYFSNNFRNLIAFDLVRNAYFNVARANSNGVEVGAAVTLVPGVLTGRLTYTHLEAEDAVTGLTLARRPRHSGRASLAWTPTDRLTIEPVLYFVSSRFSSPNELNRLPAYARLDMRVDYKIDETWTVFARGENLTNTRYQEVVNYGTTGAAAYVGIRGRW